MRQNCSFREIGIFSEKISLKMSLRMNLSQKLLTLFRISLWHYSRNSTLEGLLYGIGAVCVRIVVFEKSAYLVKKF